MLYKKWLIIEAKNTGILCIFLLLLVSIESQRILIVTSQLNVIPNFNYFFRVSRFPDPFVAFRIESPGINSTISRNKPYGKFPKDLGQYFAVKRKFSLSFSQRLNLRNVTWARAFWGKLHHTKLWLWRASGACYSSRGISRVILLF